VLTLLPPVLVAINRRVGLAAVALLGAAMLLYLVYGPNEVQVLGYALRTRFSNVSRPMFEHYFEMDNWHLLWYLTLVVIALRWRVLFTAALAPMTVTLLGAFAFVFVVFFYSNAALGVADETLVNRLPLHLAPALAFYLALLWSQPPARASQLTSTPALEAIG
jgi:predicted neutral ceramidase superfamily lipid hydrolase